MEKFCTKCGAELSDRAAFCSRCGAPVNRKLQEMPAAAAECNQAAGSLAEAGLTAAKGLAAVLIGGMAAACAIAAAGMFGAAGYLFYRFASAETIALPWLFAGSLSGTPVFLAGAMGMFIAVLFALAAFSLARCIHSVYSAGSRSHSAFGQGRGASDEEERRQPQT